MAGINKSLASRERVKLKFLPKINLKKYLILAHERVILLL